MGTIANLKTAIRNPALVVEYGRFLLSKAANSGNAVRVLDGDLQLTGFVGFSEYHAAADFLATRERNFFLHHRLGPGAIVDVGANLGVLSLMFSKLWPDRRVIAFEPNPSTFDALRENIQLNHAGSVEPAQFAVGDRDGEVAFNASPTSRGTASMHTEGQHDTRVRCVTLDRYIESAGVDGIALLKVDVEGYEKCVFDGASHLLTSGRIGTVYYEVHPESCRKAGFAAEAATDTLRSHGYGIFRLTETGDLESVKPGAAAVIEYENWVALRP